MKQFTRIALLCVAALGLGRVTHAQTAGLADAARPGFLSVGGFAGREFDTPDGLTVGADGRIVLSKADLELNPRLTFRPIDGGSAQQIDVNVLSNYRLNNPGRFRPYSGLGVGIRTIRSDSGGSNSDVGLNLISGVRLAMRPGAAYEPFLQAQYTIVKEPANSFTVVFGASFSFK